MPTRITMRLSNPNKDAGLQNRSSSPSLPGLPINGDKDLFILISEPVRLVIWDLDDSFWDGTLAEAGVTARPDNIDLVKELAARGIISSICSKNDLQRAREKLIEFNIWEYFVFSSIDWTAKGPRIAAIIDNIQLRPATVMFIDDNFLNLQEAVHFCPGIQTQLPKSAKEILCNPLFAGKADPEMTRLTQYKQLQERYVQAGHIEGDSHAFLRESGIRVSIEYDVASHLSRAIELINRTNQLNFTKTRLPGDNDIAAAELTTLLSRHDIRAGLVRVTDRYGDHGWCGIYITHDSYRFLHFAFSCRILGMGVERWLYDKLGRLPITIKGEVLADLQAPAPNIDWIEFAGEYSKSSDTTTVRAKPLKRIVARGGCDLSAASHYFGLMADEVVGEFAVGRHGPEARIDHSAFLRHILKGAPPKVIEASASLGYEPQDFETRLFEEPAAESVWVLSFWADAAYMLYKHRRLNLTIPCAVPTWDDRDVRGITRNQLPEEMRYSRMEGIIDGVTENFTFVGRTRERVFKSTLRKALRRGKHVRQIFIIGDNEIGYDDRRQVHRRETAAEFNQWIITSIRPFKNVTYVNIRDFVSNEDEVHGTTHFHRLVYYRLYKYIESWLANHLSPQRARPVKVRSSARAA